MKKGIFETRVIYRDTDAGGVVYYGNYLAWTEAGRTEYLRELGFSLRDLREKNGVLFAVRKVAIDYLLPALYDDLLRIETTLKEITNATFVFNQEIYRGETLLTRAEIVVVCISAQGFRPRAIPEEVRQAIQAHK